MAFPTLNELLNNTAVTLKQWKDLWTPTTAVTTEDWASRFRIMSDGDGNQHGKFLNNFDISRCPVIREPMKSMDSKNTRMVVVKASTQTGKSQLAMNFFGKKMSQGSQLLLLVPTQTLVKTVFQRYDAMINNCPSLKRLKTPKRWSQGAYNYAGGKIIVNSSNSTTAAISHSFDTCIFDEVSTSDETKIKGTVFDSIKSRLKQYADTSKILFVSSPKDEGTILEDAWNSCEVTLEYNITCPHCDLPFIPGTDCIEFNKSKWTIDGRKHKAWSGAYKAQVREHATFNCPMCHKAISDRERAELLQKGYFTNPMDDFYINDYTDESVGYTWTALCNPETPAKDYAVNYANSKKDYSSRMAFTNESEGKTFYSQSSMASNTIQLIPLIGGVPRGRLNNNTVGVIAGVDCQRDRFYAVKMAIERKEDGSLKYRIIDNQEISRTQTGVEGFELLDTWLDTPLWFASGKQGSHVARTVIDSGGASSDDLGENDMSSTDLTRQWVANRNERLGTMSTYAVMGRGSAVKREVQITNMSPTFDGKVIPVNGQYLRSYNIKSDYFKNELSLLLDPTNLEVEPLEFYEDADKELLEHMVAEQRMKQRNGKYKWKIKGSRSRNDYFDCLVYGLASLSKNFDLGILVVEKEFKRLIFKGDMNTNQVTPKITFKPKTKGREEVDVNESWLKPKNDRNNRSSWLKR